MPVVVQLMVKVVWITVGKIPVCRYYNYARPALFAIIVKMSSEITAYGVACSGWCAQIIDIVVFLIILVTSKCNII